MNQILKIIMWIAGIISAMLLFSESTAELFPAQIVAGGVIGGIFWIARKNEGVRNEA